MEMREIVFPPESVFLRDLVSANIAYLASSASTLLKEFKVYGEKIVVEDPVDDLVGLFQIAKRNIDYMVREKIASPFLHVNDKGTWDRRVKPVLGVGAPQTYVELSRELIGWALHTLDREPEAFLDDLSVIRVKRNEVRLGSGDVANLQLFKVERYEYGRGFNEFQRTKMSVKMSVYWLAFISAAFALTYYGLSGNEAIFSLVPWEVAYKLPRYILKDVEFGRKIGVDALFEPGKGYYRRTAIYRLPPEPPTAFLLYLALEIAGDKRSLTLARRGLNTFSFARIQFTGRTFTLLGVTNFNVSGLLGFVSKLDEYSRAFLQSLARCAILLSRGLSCGYRIGSFPQVMRAVNYIYFAAIGSKNPAEATYVLTRELNLPPTFRVGEERIPTYKIVGNILSAMLAA